MSGSLIVWVWLLLLSQVDSPQPTVQSPWTCEVSGSFRSLFTVSRSIVTQKRYADVLNRLRLRLAGGRGYALSYELVADSDTHVGTLVGLPDFVAVRRRQDAEWLDLQGVVVDRSRVYSDLSLYRGSITLRTSSMTLTVGRQRIAWGTARFWSPADLFNPIDPLQIEGDIRQGVDAAQFEWAPTATRWRATAVYAPQVSWSDSTAAARLATTAAGWDVAAFGGRFRHDWVGGGDVAGQWGGAGVRAEMTYTWRGDAVRGNDALRLAAGADYAWSKLYVVGEYFYNQAQPACASIAACAATGLGPTTELLTRHRHFMSAGARYSLTPLLKAETHVVADLAGASVVVNPVLRYNAASNIDVSIGAQLFASGNRGEFRGLPRLVFAQIDVHF